MLWGFVMALRGAAASIVVAEKRGTTMLWGLRRVSERDGFRGARQEQMKRLLGLGAVLAAAIVSSAPAQNPFTEEAVERGIGSYNVQPYLSVGTNGSGYGVAFADLDSDGDADLLASGDFDGLIGIWSNDGQGHFTDESERSGIPLLPKSNGFGVGDYDADGFLDVVITRYEYLPVKVYRNLGSQRMPFQFEDVTEATGIDTSWRSEDANFGDYNNDGWLDLYITNYCKPTDACTTAYNRLYENRTDGTFINVAEALGVDDNGAGLHGMFYDFDRDGLQDLYVSNDRGHLFLNLNNRLYHNTGNGFEDISEASGADYAAWSMGTGIGDFSRTGYDDIYCTNLGVSGYMVNTGGLSFHYAAEEAGVPNNGAGWAAAMFDFNNSGYLSLYICNTGNTPGGNRLYIAPNGFPATNVAFTYGVTVQKKAHCIALADINGNGAIDFVHAAVDDRLRLFINHEALLRRWIKFKLEGNTPNTFAIGTMIDIEVDGQWQHRQLAGGNNYKGENHFIDTLHFGIGSATTVDQAIITWPGGRTQTVLTNLEANQTVVVEQPDPEPADPADLNNDGSVNVLDLLILLGAWGACGDPGNCPADLNSDDSVNVLDLLILLGEWG